jgi:pimeloyl-ACP methyl ester carboxylesterase
VKILRTLLKYTALAVVVLAAAGAAYQWIASTRDAQRFPMPGNRVDIGGRSLHLYCSGDGPVTVLLENGLGGNYSAWRLVQSSLSQFARACSYDRAGLGWSDASDRPTRAEFVSDDLHRLMVAAGLSPPFVLVGWSAGGVFVRRYYRDHPDGVIGMVFVESSHEQQRQRLAESQDTQREGLRQLDLCRAVAWSGAVRALGVMEKLTAPLHLPETLAAETVSMENRAEYCGGVAHEMVGFAPDISQAEPPASLGDLPLVVLTRGRRSTPQEYPIPVTQAYLDGLDRTWFQLQDELAALSTRASHRVAADSGHAISLQAPDVVVTAVRDVIGVNGAASPQPPAAE